MAWWIIAGMSFMFCLGVVTGAVLCGLGRDAHRYRVDGRGTAAVLWDEKTITVRSERSGDKGTWKPRRLRN